MRKRVTNGAAEPALTEPVKRDCLFVTGGAFEVAQGTIRLVMWSEMPDLGGESRERRIVARVAMAKRTAREVCALLSDALDED